MPDNGIALERREAQGSSQGPARPGCNATIHVSLWASRRDQVGKAGKCRYGGALCGLRWALARAVARKFKCPNRKRVLRKISTMSADEAAKWDSF